MKKTESKTNITDLLKNGYPDACKLLNRTELTLEQFSFMGDQAAAFFALHKIVTVIEAINEGHEFDWNNDDEYKHYPWWDMETYDDAPAGSGFSLRVVYYAYTGSAVGARLSTRSEEHSKFVAELMMPEYKIWIKK